MTAHPIQSTLPVLPARCSPDEATLDAHATATVAVRAVEIANGAEWNRLVLDLGDPDLRQGFEWGELRRDFEGRTLRYAVLDGGSPIAAIAATVWRPFGSPFPLLYASRGPVLRTASDRAWQGVVQAAADMAARTGAVVFRLSPALPNDDRGAVVALERHGFRHLAADWTLWNAPRVVMTLDLRPGEAELKRRMRESTRLSLTRVQKNGGHVDRDLSEEGVARLHRLLAAAGRSKGYPVRDLQFFRSLHREYLARAQGALVLARRGDRDLAGVLAVRFGRRAHLLYSCVDAHSPEARKLRAGTGAHWEMIRWMQSAGCEVLDWGGAGTGFPPGPESPGYGIYEFKRGFGCRVTYLTGYHDLVFRPALYRVFRWLETRWAPALWRLRARLNA